MGWGVLIFLAHRDEVGGAYAIPGVGVGVGVGVPSWLKFLEQVCIDAYNWLITGPILPKLVWMMLLGVMKEYIGLNTESEP